MFTLLCVSTVFPSEMLAALVLVCLSVGLKCWKLCLHMLCVSTVFPSEMLAAQEVLVCLSVGLKCWKFCWVSCAYTVVCEYYLPFRDVGCTGKVLVCLSVGSKCWKFCWVSCAYTVVCEYYLPFRDVGCTGTCVPIGWFEVLEVLLGELCLHCCVRVLSPLQRCWLHWYLCAYRLV